MLAPLRVLSRLFPWLRCGFSIFSVVCPAAGATNLNFAISRLRLGQKYPLSTPSSVQTSDGMPAGGQLSEGHAPQVFRGHAGRSLPSVRAASLYTSAIIHCF